MMEVEGVVRKWGNSLGIIIPKEAIEKESIKEDEKIKFMILRDTRVLKESFGTLKRTGNKSAGQIMRELDRELYPDDYK